MILLAGPNGAGKSTASTYLLRDALKVGEFVNADAIASGLSGFAPETVAIQAGRIVLRRMRELIAEGSSFAFETTLSSRSLKNIVRDASAAGFEVELIYLSLPSPAIALQRVAGRVRSGGHHVAPEVIKRRFHRSLLNLFEMYMPAVTRWKILDNYVVPAETVATGTRGRKRIMVEHKWEKLVELSRLLPGE